MKSMQGTVKDLNIGDRIHLFWQQLPDGSILNGGCNILEITNKIPEISKEHKEEFTDLINYIEKNGSDNLKLIKLQLDYYSPSYHVMHDDIPLEIYRKK